MDVSIPLKLDQRGLIPAILQDAETGEVLMVAWMNEEALRLTRETGEAHFWSRSRQELWHKGATSGSIQRVREIWVDCDADTLLLKVDPAGPACHTGAQSCFFREIWPQRRGPVDTAGDVQAYAPTDDILQALSAVIEDRKRNPTPGSYTAALLSGGDEVLKKVGEEAVELILAGKGQSDQRVIEEAADVIYHLMVLLASRDLTLEDVRRELVRRRG
ncbi:MAG: bifunctional phosphoribosyl-AMP cyclohydrolase/phosphoribosyl-ATP diphosphatase HisIE [Anaerolineae bacterium]